MRVTAHLVGMHAFVEGFIGCPVLPEPKLILFMIDTGCTNTTILQDDTVRLRLNWRDLQRGESVETANGVVASRCLPEVQLYLPARRGIFNRSICWVSKFYPAMCVLPPESDPEEHIPDLSGSRSLLGMDFLLNFPTWHFKDNKLYLDT